MSEKKSKSSKIRMIIVLVILFIFAIWQLITNRAEYLKIKEISESYTSVFWSNFYMKIIVFGVSFAVTYILFYINNKIIKKGMKSFFEKEEKEMPKLPNKSISFIAAILAGEFSLKYLYLAFLSMKNATYFGKTDPIFGHDIGYYMFVLPFIKNLIIFLLLLSLIMIIYTAIYYVLAINLSLKNGVDMQDLKKSIFVKQIKVLAIIFGALISVYILIQSEDILTGKMLTIKDESSTELVGAGLTDTAIKLWGYRILAVIVFISIIRIVINASVAKFKKCIFSATIIPIYLVLMFGVLIYFQEVYVGSSELDKEKKYIKYNIDATKEAYAIDVDQKNINNYIPINTDLAIENESVLENIPIVNSKTIEQTITNTQDNSTYYSYSNSNLGVYNIKGSRVLLSLTPREIINDSKRSFNNKTFEYTHGYSVVSAVPSEIDQNGYVKLNGTKFDESDDILNIKEPRIYFGLKTNNPIIVNSSYGREFDYPISTSSHESYEYQGDAGIHLNLFDRFAVGVTSGDYAITFSKYIDKDTKIITTRNIIERAKTLLPYIEYDENPYLVVTDSGELVWIIDGYTTSSEYPYSQSTTLTKLDGTKKTINYIRNSVKVLVNAYDGKTEFYITDRTDPIIMMYRNMFPDLFMNLDEEIPADIQKNIVYPQYLFNIQAGVLSTYHDITEDMLYRADDIWSLSTDGKNQIDSKYTMLRLNDSKETELGIVSAYTKSGKSSLTSYAVGAVENGTNKLFLYKLPSDSNVIGVAQFNTLIEEDETISEELKTLSVSGVEIVKDIIIVPIKNSILYVEPVYQVRLNESETQILKKIIVSSGNKVAIGDNLEEAIENLLSDNNSIEVEYVDMEDINQVVDSVIEAKNNLKESMDSQDLEMVGKDLNTLQELLDQLEVLRKQELENAKKRTTDEYSDILGTED